MKYILYVSLAAITLSSCVSNKKYAELESEVERLKSTELALSSVSDRASAPMDPEENPEILALRRMVEDAHQEMGMLKAEMEVRNMNEMTPEQQRMWEEEKSRMHHEEMLNRDSQNEVKKSEEAFGATESRLGLTHRAATGALSKYESGEVIVDKMGSFIVITVKDKTLFSTDKQSISASGETFVNRFSPVLEMARGSKIYIQGISENLDGRSDAFAKALVLDMKLGSLSTYKTYDALIGAQTCDNAKSKRQSGCDKVEIIIEGDYDEAMNLLRTGQ
jgi:chemotaxis protein MotB